MLTPEPICPASHANTCSTITCHGVLNKETKGAGSGLKTGGQREQGRLAHQNSGLNPERASRDCPDPLMKEDEFRSSHFFKKTSHPGGGQGAEKDTGKEESFEGEPKKWQNSGYPVAERKPQDWTSACYLKPNSRKQTLLRTVHSSHTNADRMWPTAQPSAEC